MSILAIDYTANLPSHLVTNEVKNVQLEVDRIFGLSKGAFYVKDLVVRNVATGAILLPGVDYKLYELEPELHPFTGGNVAYYLIHVSNRNIGIVSIDYRAVGGKFQINAVFTANLLEKYVGSDGTYPYGNLSQRPVKFTPTFHLQSADTIFDAGALVNSIHALADSIENGDPLLVSHLTQHIETIGEKYQNDAQVLVSGLESRLLSAEAKVSYAEGQILVTDSPENPAVRFGGYWMLNPDILLYGTDLEAEIGDLIPIATGTGVSARKTFIWTRGEDLGQVTFALAASASNVNEGGTVTFTLTTTGLSAGTQVPYQINGSSSFNGADIAPTALSGRFTINGSGIGTLDVTVAADVLTEGTEDFTLTLTNVTGQSRKVIIADTSKAPAMTLKFSANPSGTGTITQVNEGSSLYLVITSANLTYPHTVNLSYLDSVTNPSDFVDALPASVILYSATEIVEYQILSDRMTEGNETFLVTATSATFVTPQQKSITVRDTSLSSSFSAYFSSSPVGSGTITQRNEGQTFYLIFTTTNVDAGEVFNLVYSGSLTAGDFTGMRAGTLTIGGDGKAVATYVVASDVLTEGNETMLVTIQKDGNTVASQEITVIDTSQNPQYEAFFRTGSTGVNYVTQRNEGQVVYFGLRTTGVAAGTTYTIEYAGSATSGDFADTRPTSITIGSNGEGSILYTLKNDQLTEGSENLTILVKQGATLLASATLNIVDTSVNSTYALRFSGTSSGSGTITQVNEDAPYWVVLNTSNVDTGTIFTVERYANGTGTNLGSPSLVTNSSGQAIFQVSQVATATNDTGRFDRYIVKFNGVQVATADISIVEINTLSVSSYFSASVNGTGTITETNEGTTAHLVLSTLGYPEGKSFDISISGTGNSVGPNSEWASAPPTTITVGPLSATQGRNIRTVAFNIGNDFTTDGNKTLTVTLRDPAAGNVQVGQVAIVIKDTSKTPIVNSYWASDALGNTPITATAATGTVYYILETQNMANGSTIDLSWDTGSTYPFSNLLIPPVPVAVTVNNNRASHAFVLTQASEAWAARFQAAATQGLPEITQANEGSTVALAVIWNSNIVPPTNTIYLDYPLSGVGYISAGDISGGLPISMAISIATNTYYGSQNFVIGNDVTTEGNELLVIDLYSDAGKTQFIKRVTLTVLDTSIAPEITINILNEPGQAARGPINLYDLFVATQGTAPTSSTRVHFVVKAGTTLLGALRPTNILDSVEYIQSVGPAITAGNWPTGSQVRGTTEVNGAVVAMGGIGASYYDLRDIGGDLSYIPASPGWGCIVAGENQNHSITWQNYGFMASGAGGGGLSGWINNQTGTLSQNINHGGSGAAYGQSTSLFQQSASAGQPGGIYTGGAGGNDSYGANALAGGSGGDAGKSGNVGFLRRTNGTIEVAEDPFTRPATAGPLILGALNFQVITMPGALTRAFGVNEDRANDL